MRSKKLNLAFYSDGGLSVFFKMLRLTGMFKSYRLFRAAQWHARCSMGSVASPSVEWCIMR